jgi:hypothetical protein
MTTTHLKIALAVAVVALAFAGSAVAGSVPSNLCSLNVAPQLRALPVATTCVPSKTQTNEIGKALAAGWGGPMPRQAELRVWVLTGLSDAAFKRMIPRGTEKVAIGSDGRTAVYPGFVFVYTWSHRIGLVVNLELSSTGNLHRAAALLIAAARRDKQSRSAWARSRGWNNASGDGFGRLS